MRSVFLLGILFSSVSAADTACESVSRQRYVDGWQEKATVQRITAQVVTGSKVYCDYYPDREQQLNLLVARERGFLDGVEYELHYADGSAVIQGEAGKGLDNAEYTDNWHLSCRYSESAGQVLCNIKKDDVVIERGVDGKVRLTISANYQESSDILIRVKGQWAVTASAAEGFSPEQNDKIILQMRSGVSLDARYHQRDKQRPTDKKIFLYGFNQAFLLMEKVARQLGARKQMRVNLYRDNRLCAALGTYHEVRQQTLICSSGSVKCPSPVHKCDGNCPAAWQDIRYAGSPTTTLSVTMP